MIEKIFEFFEPHIELTASEKEIIEEHSIFTFYPAGHILLSEGQLAKQCHFVVNGLVRSYFLQDGLEKVTEFYPELSGINPVSYITGEPSTYFIDCIEDCIISPSDQDRSKEFFEKLPRLKDTAIKLQSEINAQQQLSLDDFKHLPPEKRYEKFLSTRPDLANRIPQYMIASYLGIQPQSLSRIRKRMRDQNV